MKMHKWFLMFFLFWTVGAVLPAVGQTTPQETNTVEQSSQPQTASEPEMADMMRQDGKIFIVVAVLVSILLGVLLYLISLDKKIGLLERELKN